MKICDMTDEILVEIKNGIQFKAIGYIHSLSDPKLEPTYIYKII